MTPGNSRPDDGSAGVDDAFAAGEPEVVDLDAPEPEPGDRTTPTGPSSRLRTLMVATALVAALALGVFLGHLNARNATANTLRVFPGDLVVNVFTTDTEQWHGSLTVINDGEQPVDIIGIEVPGLELAMISESVTVAPGERAAANVTLSPDCDVLATEVASRLNTDDATDEAPEDAPEELPLTLAVATEEGAETLETPVAIAPGRSMGMLNAECARADVVHVATDLEVDTVDDHTRPDETLNSRGTLTAEGLEGEVIGMRSLMPGYTVTTDELPLSFGTSASTTFIDITWSVEDCALATSSETIRNGPHVGVTIRAEIDGERTDRSVQGTVSGAVAMQLGQLAASSCPA